MDAQTRENWRKIKQALEAAGKTDTFFYQRAVAICKGANDPMESLPFESKRWED